MSTETETKEIVDIMFIGDWDQHREDNPDAPEWGDWVAIVAHLARWDYGTETDAAFTVGEEPVGPCDDSLEIKVGGLVYTLVTNYELRYAQLIREPLESE